MTTQEIREQFDTHIEGCYVRKDETYFDWEYDVKVFAPGIYMAIDRLDHDGHITELRLRGEDGQWAGPSVQIYAPEVDVFHRGDDGYPIKQPEVSASSSRVDSLQHMRAFSAMITLAVDYAEAWMAEERSRLESEAAEKWLRHKEERAEWRARSERFEEALKEREGILDAYIGQPDCRFRVTLRDKKARLVGEFQRRDEEGKRSQYLIIIGTATHEFYPEDIECLEEKAMSGRFLARLIGGSFKREDF